MLWGKTPNSAIMSFFHTVRGSLALVSRQTTSHRLLQYQTRSPSV